MNEPDPAFVRVQELTAELGIAGTLRLEMLADPERAVAVLEHARRARRIRNVAGFAIANWRSGFDPRPAAPPEPEPEPELGPPTLEALEHAWSLEPSPVITALLSAMAIALDRAGGFKPLQAEFRRIGAELGAEDAAP